MKRIYSILLLMLLAVVVARAQRVTVKWELGDVDNLSAVIMTTDDGSTAPLQTAYVQGSHIASVVTLAQSDAEAGFDKVAYEPPFARYTPTTKVTTATQGHSVGFSIVPDEGHTLKVTRISFDCVKIGTDGGSLDAVAETAGGQKTSLTPVDMVRNKVSATNPTPFSHNEYAMADMVVDDKGMTLQLYIYNFNGADNSSPKSVGIRNVVVEGVMDEQVYDASHYLSAFTCMAKTGDGEAAQTDLYALVKNLKNGQNARFAQKLYDVPTDFAPVLRPELGDGYTVKTDYDTSVNTLKVTVLKGQTEEFGFSVGFAVTTLKPKGQPVALKRGLMALYTGSGNLVSWRARKTDSRNLKFKLYRGTATSQRNTVNSGYAIAGKTNFLDAAGVKGHYYRLEVIDENGQVVETDISGPAWDGQVSYITLQGGAPTDPTSAKATYTPNDASFCDMDGDGEYDIILKWAPSNEKDAASSGTTSPAFYACYKLDGTRLWMLHTGHNMFNSAHTTPFVAWDLDGDGFGEFMVKTAPGAVDGQGNYVLLPGDNPTASYKNGKGKQTSGPEYITVFDGTTGAELKTISYHTAYADESTAFWGDSEQNRSERYLACIAWLDGEDSNPSAIFARGYYSGCKIGAYDWDGQNLTLRWLHRGESATKGTVTYADGTVTNLSKTVYGEGAHWISIGDVTGDGKQEIHYGSGALNPDGTTLYRTGLEHGDALHLGDFIPSRPGQEFFMTLEHKPYGANLRDARTGQLLWRTTAGTDTGRGIMAHFNPESEDAYWQSSADANLYDTQQDTIRKNVTHGGGASLNNRIYWNGFLSDDFYDKSVLEYWEPTANEFWRMKVNGGNYTIGTLNNDSKYNPCVLGDLMGDWREEIVNWTQNANGDFQLVVNATDYQTDYTFPHLMDDYAYRAQVISQNDGYNQPPHVSYDQRTEKTITAETFEVEPTNPDFSAELGNYWGALFVTYPVIVPQGVTAWAVANRSTDDADTLKVNRLEAGTIIPANRGIIFNAQQPEPAFVPTSLSTTTTVTASYLRGSYCDSLVAEQSDVKFAYEFRNGNRGVGFYRTYGQKTFAGGEPFAIFGTASRAGDESYVLGKLLNPGDMTDGISIVCSDAQQQKAETNRTFSVTGVALDKEPLHGIYIKNGRKFVK